MSEPRSFATIALGFTLFIPAVLSVGCKAGPQHSSKAAVRTESDETTRAARTAAATAALTSFTVTWPQHDPTQPQPHLLSPV